MTRIILISILSLAATNLVLAQTQEKLRGNFSVATNPSYFVLGGYSVRGHYILPSKWSFGLATEAGFEIPEFAGDQFFDNNKDITVDWDFLVALEARYRFTDDEVDKGFFLQGAFGYEGWSVESETGATDEFTNWFASLSLGYHWYPLKKKHFHLGANYSLIFLLNNTDERFVGESVYHLRSVVPPSLIPSLSLGWRFK